METILAGAVIKKLYFYFFDFLGDFLGQISNLQKIKKKALLKKKNRKKIIRATPVGTVMRFIYLFLFLFLGAFLGKNLLFESAPPP